ncbi:MAG: type IV pilin-like G/H family protein [Pseudanabaena sp. CAN_BIN31]|nr:type IV pilin-like G/H family protein [Pseudanabaena sp. CAN_BIN31]
MLNKKNGEKGFTLIELLVVIIIIGILAAIALPSFLNQAAKARQSEAKTYVGSINRSQQAYLLEKQLFSPNLLTLGLGIAGTTANYAYGTGSASLNIGSVAVYNAMAYGIAGLNGQGGTSGAINTTNADTMVQSTSAPSNKSYIGVVARVTAIVGGDATALGTVCEQQITQLGVGLNSTTIAGTLAGTTGTTYMSLSTNAAPVCSTGVNATNFNSIQ